MKVALYARYSSDNQRDASIADQIRVCRLFAERQGWIVADEFCDPAVSGATLLRPGFQALFGGPSIASSMLFSPSHSTVSVAIRKTRPVSSSGSPSSA
jgi:hypothetical protein